jgi:DNA helicase-2/ATP-dependent DNA helicase PcrA
MRRGKLPDALFANGLPAGTTEDLEEERRLLYVAMTRAKDDRHLIVPQRFMLAAKGSLPTIASMKPQQRTVPR